MVAPFKTFRWAGVAASSMALILACSSSNFKGSADTKASSLNGGGTGADGSGGGTDGSANGGGSGGTDGSANGGGSGGNDGADNGGANGGNGGNGTDGGGAVCKPNTVPNNYNIMFVFDNTGSQLQTDPQFVRRSGALSFLDQFNTYVSKFPTAQVYMGVLSFNTKSIHSANGWMLLNGTSAGVIKQEIVTATTNPNGLTAYSPVLQDAANYFSQVNALANAQAGRNYLVFLTDGDPNADTTSAINAAVANLVTNYGVAMISVATGPDVSTSGQTLVKSLALPAAATKFPDHIGRYYRAADAASLQKTWENLFGNLGGCK